MKWILPFLTALVFVASFALGARASYADTSKDVSAVVKIGICGDGNVDGAEECDGSGLNGYSCSALGFSGGNLNCSSSCDFDTSSCNVPSLNNDGIPASGVKSLVAAGYLTVPVVNQITSTPSVVSTVPIKIVVPQNSSSSAVFLPQGLIISREDGENFDPTKDLSIASVSTSSVSGLTGFNPVGALQWGISGTALSFDTPITINLFVGASYKGSTLVVYRSESLGNGWTTNGLIDSQCTVDTNGFCSFRASKASYYLAAQAEVSTPSPTSTTPDSSSSSNSSGTSSTTSSDNSPTSPLIRIITSIFRLPNALKPFDIGGDGHIFAKDLPQVATMWFNGFRDDTSVCDIDRNGSCDMKDFSILMYYVGR